MQSFPVFFQFAALCFVFTTVLADGPAVKLEQRGGKILVYARFPQQTHWTELAVAQVEPGARTYLHPVRDPSGRQVLTQDRPEDHPWQHGIFTGYHRVNGFNYWKEDEGRQRLVRVFDVQSGPDKAGWKSLSELVSPAGEVVLEEEHFVTFLPPDSSDAYRIDFDVLLKAKSKEVQFGKFFVGGLSVRMIWDSANPKQSHLNSNGLTGRAGEQQKAQWCTVERPFGDEILGIAILDHPGNSHHPPVWRVDEQGLINPNVSGASDWMLKTGEERRLRHRIVVYRGHGSAERIRAEFQRFANQ